MITSQEKQFKSILIVDNSTSNLDLMRKTLERQRYQVKLADSGKSALNQVIKESPDLILLNLMLLTSDDSGMTSYLSDVARLSKIPLLFFHGNSNLDREEMNNLEPKTIQYQSLGLDILLLKIHNLFQAENEQAENEQEKSNHQQQREKPPLFPEKVVFMEISQDDPLRQEQEELEVIQNNYPEAIFWHVLSMRGYAIIDAAAA